MSWIDKCPMCGGWIEPIFNDKFVTFKRIAKGRMILVDNSRSAEEDTHVLCLECVDLIKEIDTC